MSCRLFIATAVILTGCFHKRTDSLIAKHEANVADCWHPTLIRNGVAISEQTGKEPIDSLRLAFRDSSMEACRRGRYRRLEVF